MWTINSFAPALSKRRAKAHYLHLQWDTPNPSHHQLEHHILPNLNDELAQTDAKTPTLYLMPSPLEGMLLKLRLTNADADDEPLARALLGVGLSLETLHAWADNPLVDAAGGRRVPLFDAFAGLSGGQLLAKAQAAASEVIPLPAGPCSTETPARKTSARASSATSPRAM